MNLSALYCLPLLGMAFVVSAQPASQVDPASAPAATSVAPAVAGCGRISVFDVAPRSKDLYRARLMNVDGELPGPTSARSFRVSAGKHTLEVAEAIDDNQFTGMQLRQRVQQSDRYKTIELDVQPNTTYLLAAHLIEANRSDIIGQTYWEPVIYQHNSEACK
ncbi:hypothetical protein MNR01_10815 [Lysobacter sp. S4-A87]|uniref:hypothetical protein n=1 Tax=Lysobacter sp. S4-A87 TaxID=2925843 RepID=UPI001F53851F|nr:hypothetical protein [Lysobacter sp. S4-A87]UNK48264.1 hypothetical protein MNR01_10815 [Lysobacter sp. S4-A87]